jgi:catechol 2,3-dioxygenase-like lactoylglutathione lyase family enzyme
MSHVRRFDHVGLTIADLDVVTAFFVALGLEVEGRTFVEGEFLDTVCGIPGSRTEIVMLKPPGDGTRLELSSFVRPDSVPGSPAAVANELGLRNVAFEVNDLQAAVDWAATEGYGLVGGIGEYEGAWRMAYVRGPEGIVVSLAERIVTSALARRRDTACSALIVTPEQQGHSEVDTAADADGVAEHDTQWHAEHDSRASPANDR